MKKFLSIALAVLLIAACFAGCGEAGKPTDASANTNATEQAQSDLAYIQNKGKLIVGITDYEPMDYKDENGNWTGFDAEFATMFADELGVEVEFFEIADWDKKFVELDTKNIDVVWNGMTITEEVTLNSNCSDPYVVNAQVVVMKADAIDNYTTPESMKELTFAVENGSAGQDAAEAIEPKDIIKVQNQAATLMEVAAGTADACVIDITMAHAMTGEGTNYANLKPGISLTSEEYGVGFRKNSDVTAKFNDFMKSAIADGSLKALADKYSLTLAG